MKKLVAIIIVLTMLFAFAGCTGQTAEYPNRAIKLIVPFGTGGGADQFARILEQEIEANSDMELTIVNVPGAATAVGFESFMKEDADGYTMMIATTDTIINLAQGISEGDISDIEAIAVPQLNVDMLFINADETRFTNFDEMVAYSIDNDVELQVATLGVEGSEFLTLSAISEVTGAQFALIPYSEPGERYAALAGGHVDVLFEQPGDVRAFVDSGEYTPVISMSENRLDAFSNVPCSVELGIDVTNGYWRAILVKSDVSEDYTEILREAIMQAIATQVYQDYANEKYLNLREGYYDKNAVSEFIISEYNYYK